MKPRSSHMKGQIAVVMTFAIATLLGVMALGTDVAVMYFNWVQLQKGADAAALAGAFYLIPVNRTQYPIDSVAVAAAGCSARSDDAKRAACLYAYNNKMAVDTNNLKIDEDVASLPTSTRPNIQVWVNRPNLPYLFGRVIGLNTYSVSAIATGQDAYVGSFSGPEFPMVYQCTGTCPGMSSLAPGLIETPPFGGKFVNVGATGNWAFLDPGVPGGSALGNAVAGGLAMPDLSIGSDVRTKTGITWGQVNSGWTTRMNEHNALCSAGSLPGETCSDPSSGCTMAASGTKIPSIDPLLVTLPVADVSGCTGSCSVPVTGFALVYMYAMTKVSPDGVSISGCFVQQADPGGGGGVAGAPNLGAIAPASLIQ